MTDQTETDQAAETGDRSATGASHRRDVLKLGGTALASVTGLAGCLSNGGGDGGTSTSGDGGTSTSGELTNIAIISSPAGFGDGAFNDLALQGLQAAAEEHNIRIQQVEETQQSRYQTVQSRLAESTNPDYELIVLVGFNHTQALETNAAEYPDQNWMLINDYVDQPNVAGYTWANHQMSFQAGVLAATMTTRELSHEGNSTNPDGRMVGFVGGVDGSLINAFERAYVAGVEWVDDSIEVRVGYAGSYDSPQQGEQVAQSQYDAGADIIYHAAAATGRGVFQAAQDQNRFAIGVDSDQSRTLPDYQNVIIGSAVKRINVGTNEVATAVVNGNWDSVQGSHVLGLEEEAVEVVIGQAFEDQLPDVVNTNLQDSRAAILNGDVTVPCSASGCSN